MKQAGVSKELREELVGHADNSVNATVYSEKFALATLAEAIAKIPVLIDIQALRYTRGDFVAVLQREMRAAPRRLDAARKRAERAATGGAGRATTDGMTTDAATGSPS
jgi:hypothetical protein